MTLNVLIADDQTLHWESLRINWERALGKDMRYELFIDLDSVEQRLPSRPHIVIVDNHFTAATNEGSKFIANNKIKYPDTLFILMTSKSFDIEQLGQRNPNPDFIVPKSYLLIENYRDYVGSAIRSAVSRSPGTVSIPSTGLKTVNITSAAFVSLVEQCLSTIRMLDFNIENSYNASFSLLSGGYSGATVYQMRVEGEGRSPALPLVLKCGSREQISRELASFERYVRWQLPHDMRVDVIGKGLTRDHAAVCYGFVLGSSTKLISLTELINAKNFKLVDGNIRRIFLAERTGWYRNIVEKDTNLSEYLLNRFEFKANKDDKRNRRLVDTLQNISKKEDISLICSGGDMFVFGENLGSIRKGIFQSKAINTRLTYGHGDLNSNNVFIDKQSRGLALIDFEQSGEINICRDLISIETSIRMEIPAEVTDKVSFKDLFKEELRIFNQQPGEEGNELHEYRSWIENIRAVTLGMYNEIDPLEYQIPLILHSWKVLGIKKWNSESERRLAAVVMAGLKYLNDNN